MSAPWLHVIGIGEDGMAGLSAAARTQVEQAEVIIGGDRHHGLAPNITAERVAWPSPFDAMIETIRSHQGRRVVVLVTGDPLWFSVGARIANPKNGDPIPAHEITYHPQLSAFQWASCRMGWSLADTETITAHGRAVEQVIPYFWPGARLLILTSGAETPAEVAALLTARGYGASRMTVFGALGGAHETRHEGRAADWAEEVPAFNTLAVEVIGQPDALYPRLPGLPDDAFVHDGKMTKREIRALTLAKLMPARGEMLWDIGTGCGSIAIEWMRAAPDAMAIGIDDKPARLDMARTNALALGVPKLRLIEGTAPAALADLPRPDAIFIGGGLTRELAEMCHEMLGANGRLVANAVTLESEAILLALHEEVGGELVRMQAARAEPVGPYRGWRAAMPVTQWSVVL
jgi:precorrin-6Y C5,15-methyltransferase (decarboxylating)